MILLLSGAAVVFGYLLGSIPVAYLAAKWASAGAIDVRRSGDGNAGANNVGRLLGRRWAFLVGGIDLAKGVAAVLIFNLLAHWLRPSGVDNPAPAQDLLAGLFTISPPGMLAGAAALAGQVWPAWVRFRGGRGAATAVGVTAAVLPGPALLLALPAAAILAITRSTTVTLTFMYLSSLVVAKALFGIGWGPVCYCLGIFVAVGLVHFWTVRFRRPAPETTPAA